MDTLAEIVNSLTFVGFLGYKKLHYELVRMKPSLKSSTNKKSTLNALQYKLSEF